VPVGGGEHKERGNEGECGGCVLYSYMKSRRMKPVEIALRRRGRGKRENDGRGKSKIHCKHLCKYHNVFPCTTIIY
jgi:hypothetical protein